MYVRASSDSSVLVPGASVPLRATDWVRTYRAREGERKNMALHQSDMTMAASDHSAAAAAAVRASGHETKEEEEDLIASPPNLWCVVSQEQRQDAI